MNAAFLPAFYASSTSSALAAQSSALEALSAAAISRSARSFCAVGADTSARAATRDLVASAFT